MNAKLSRFLAIEVQAMIYYTVKIAITVMGGILASVPLVVTGGLQFYKVFVANFSNQTLNERMRYRCHLCLDDNVQRGPV